MVCFAPRFLSRGRHSGAIDEEGPPRVPSRKQVLSAVYFEHQEPDSYLCVLHCLNNVLQGPYFSLDDLISISNELDEAERALLQGHELLQAYTPASLNASLTGFFSAQVLLAALASVGIHPELLRWKASETRSLQRAAWKAVQYGAVLVHYDSHWLAWRRVVCGLKLYWVLLDSYRAGPEIRRTEQAMAQIELYLRAKAVVYGIPKEALPETPLDQFCGRHTM
jgi:ataxin-3